jgi:hypothetical protein
MNILVDFMVVVYSWLLILRAAKMQVGTFFAGLIRHHALPHKCEYVGSRCGVVIKGYKVPYQFGSPLV